MESNMNRMYDLMEMCYQGGTPVFSDFLDLSLLTQIRTHFTVIEGVFLMEYLGFADDERRMVGFFPSEFKEYMTTEALLDMFPVRIIYLYASELANNRFSHRDVLGSVLSLGLNRKVIGDIIVKSLDAYKGQEAYLLCHERVVDILLSELIMIKNSSVNVSLLDDNSKIATLLPDMKEIKASVASMRTDAIVTLLAHCSRSESCVMIERGLVLINQNVVMKPHKLLKENDIISIKKVGKFKIHSIGQLTKKGRLSVSVYQYI